MINPETEAAIGRLAAVHGMEPAGLAAFIDTESAGVSYALVDGHNEPLIRWEGHYFHRLCAPSVLDRAVAQGLASPKAGGIANPERQQDRWDRLLKPAMVLDRQPALESCSWGMGQVMGANWKMLGFASVLELVDRARENIEGQVELIVRFIEKTGLKGALARHDWATVAHGYNGANYAVNHYDTKMAAAYQRHVQAATHVSQPGHSGSPAVNGQDGSVLGIQKMLVAHGFPVTVDGMRGPKTTAAIMAFQTAKGLVADGIVGRFTLAALQAE